MADDGETDWKLLVADVYDSETKDMKDVDPPRTLKKKTQKVKQRKQIGLQSIDREKARTISVLSLAGFKKIYCLYQILGSTHFYKDSLSGNNIELSSQGNMLTKKNGHEGASWIRNTGNQWQQAKIRQSNRRQSPWTHQCR